MPSRQPGPNSQHRVATYNKGCRCELCVEAKKRAWRKIRSNRRIATEDPRLRRCPECGLSFMSGRGFTVHQTTVH